MRDAAIADKDLMLGNSGDCGEIAATRKPATQTITSCKNKTEAINYNNVPVDLTITDKTSVNIGELTLQSGTIEISSPEMQINKLNITEAERMVILSGKSGFTAKFLGQFYDANSGNNLHEEMAYIKSELAKLKPS